MNVLTQPYIRQCSLWPKSGRHILAQFDDQSVVVYQAYRPAIGSFAVANGHFGGDAFSFSRMSWIKPNFLWMMYRSGWGTKPDQEVTLGLRIRRAFFDTLLAQAVPSSWDRRYYTTQDEWAGAVRTSDVRLQWDPDHHPSGAALDRRAIQIGLRGSALHAFAGPGNRSTATNNSVELIAESHRELLEVIDLTAFVAEQRRRISASEELVTPTERVYRPADPLIAERLGLDSLVVI
ncbi:DUF4291 domain-containing protein [Humisphaera borealis]|uniref:DUF4291 domain-containing protein n=1 Tax=Humisphaera borealis TaxID=2807512 RepID=A0A7M2WQN7_9BACT|nr:DUF4291 domain-containing protein [Humisphaera borealis]QOV87733.1 DUF4291 domain-containing protein [Humisphaera borealis]